MKRKLKTWRQFEKEFKPLAKVWNDNGTCYIECENDTFDLIQSMKKYFGTKIEVEEVEESDNDSVYTHFGLGYGWHEICFEPEFEEIEFLSKKEVEI